MSKQVQRKKSHHNWGNVFHVTAQSWSLLSGKIQSAWSTIILLLLEKVNRNKQYFFSFQQFKFVQEGQGEGEVGAHMQYVHVWE